MRRTISGAATLPIAACLLFTAASTVRGQESTLPSATQHPASTRAMGLGGSYAASSGHADAIFYHPALLIGAAGFGVDLQRWGGNSSATAASAAMGWLGGGVGVGLRTMQYSAFGAGALAGPPAPDTYFGLGSVPVSERIVSVGYARSLPIDLDLGVVVDFVDERVGSARHNVALVDVGVAKEVGIVQLALSAQDIGDKPVNDTGAGPSRVVLGAGAYGRPVGIFDIGFAAHVGLDADDDALFGAGVELGYWPIQGRTFVARLGFQNVPEGSDAAPFTTGFAFWGDDITVEWAWRPVSGADEGGTHRFGVRWR